MTDMVSPVDRAHSGVPGSLFVGCGIDDGARRDTRGCHYVAAPYQEWPMVIRRRKVTVGIVLVVGAVVLALSPARPGRRRVLH